MARVVLRDLQPDSRAVPRHRRKSKHAVDVTLTHEVAAWLEENLPRRTELIHTAGMGWLLRRWDSWVGLNGPRDGWVEIDSAPEDHLGAMLLRYLTASATDEPDRSRRDDDHEPYSQHRAEHLH